MQIWPQELIMEDILCKSVAANVTQQCPSREFLIQHEGVVMQRGNTDMNTQSHGGLCVIVGLHDQPDGTGITHGTHSE